MSMLWWRWWSLNVLAMQRTLTVAGYPVQLRPPRRYALRCSIMAKHYGEIAAAKLLGLLCRYAPLRENRSLQIQIPPGHNKQDDVCRYLGATSPSAHLRGRLDLGLAPRISRNQVDPDVAHCAFLIPQLDDTRSRCNISPRAFLSSFPS